MQTVTVADDPDIALIVAKTLTLEVSSEKLMQSTKFDAMLSSGCPEGDMFQTHQDEGYEWLFELPLPHDEPDGVWLLMFAVHERFDVGLLCGSDNSGPESRELKGLQSFARMADYHQFTILAVVKAAARLAIESISAHERRTYPELVLRSAYLLDRFECFSELTDNISKYEGPEVAERLKEKDLGNGKQIYGRLTYQQQLTHKMLLADVQSAIARLTCFLCEDHDHTPTSHDFREEQSDQLPTKESYCDLHHFAIMKCLKLMARRGLGHSNFTDEGSSLCALVDDINQLDSHPDGPGWEVTAPCYKATEVKDCYEKMIAQLKRNARMTWAGVCLPCFKGFFQPRMCSHVKPVAQCPQDDLDERMSL